MDIYPFMAWNCPVLDKSFVLLRVENKIIENESTVRLLVHKEKLTYYS